MAKTTTNEVNIPIGATDNTGAVFKQVADRFKRETSDKIKAEIDSLKMQKLALADPNVAALKGQLAALKSEVNGPQGLVAGLKSAFGEESPFGGAMKILGGAGAIAGLAMVPQVLGQIREAGAAIHELFTGDNAYFENMTAEAKKTNDYIVARRALMEKEAEIARQTADLWAEIRGDRELIGLSGSAREDVVRRQQNGKAIADLDKSRAAGRNSVGADQDKMVNDLSAQIEALKQAPLDVGPASGFSAGPGGVSSANQIYHDAEVKRAREVAALEKRMGNVAGERDGFRTTYDDETEGLKKALKANQKLQGDQAGYARAQSLDAENRRRARELLGAQRAARRAGMNPADAARAAAADGLASTRQSIMDEYEDRTRGVSDPKQLAREQTMARDRIAASQAAYDVERDRESKESRLKALRGGLNQAAASGRVTLENLLGNFGSLGAMGAGAANLGRSVLDAASLKSFVKDQKDSAEYLKEMRDLLRRQQTPGIFNG